MFLNFDTILVSSLLAIKENYKHFTFIYFIYIQIIINYLVGIYIIHILFIDIYYVYH